VVKVRFENFIEAWNYHNTLAKRTFDYTERIIISEKKPMNLFFRYGMKLKITTMRFLRS